ncbi:hypothetical protein HAX54_049594 [Datura stramonium]|uniref:DUF1985 domain-containing protein n=1 Tax=Datura stramonium TaxID=4076 RepID=A0ABS8SV38_DATST|nr:hypothetical protein [Datura stramonium]
MKMILLKWVKVPHWLGNGLMICLYGLGQSSPLELAFGVELGPGVIYLHGIRARIELSFSSSCWRSQIGNQGEDFFKLVGKSYKEKNLLEHLKYKTVPRNVKKSLCLVWFVHNVLYATNVGKNITSDWIKLSVESFKVSVEYLLRKLKPNMKTINLYGFPWAFMTWAFEVIPHLRHQVKDFQEEVSSLWILRWMAAKNNKAIVHPWIVPTKEELEMKFQGKFEPLKSCLDQKIDKLKGDLIGVTAIRRDLAGVEKDDASSKAINEVVASYAAGDATRTDNDHHSCGGGYTPLDAGGAGDTSGVGNVGGANGRYTSAAEEVRRQEDTPYMLGRSLVVGTSKVPSFACECLKYNKNMNMLLSKIEALTEAQGVTEVAINKLISKRGIYPSSRISEPFTPIVVKRRINQISMALASAKKKVAGTPKMTADQPMERLPINLYKYANDKKKKKIQQMIKLKRSTKILYIMHKFNYQDFECITNMDKWWEDRVSGPTQEVSHGLGQKEYSL